MTKKRARATAVRREERRRHLWNFFFALNSCCCCSAEVQCTWCWGFRLGGWLRGPAVTILPDPKLVFELPWAALGVPCINWGQILELRELVFSAEPEAGKLLEIIGWEGSLVSCSVLLGASITKGMGRDLCPFVAR